MSMLADRAIFGSAFLGVWIASGQQAPVVVGWSLIAGSALLSLVLVRYPRAARHKDTPRTAHGGPATEPQEAGA